MLSKIVAALTTYGPWGIFLIGFIDSLGVPLPAIMDGLIILIAVKAPDRAYLTAVMAVLGSLAGNVALFVGVSHGSRIFLKSLPDPGNPGRFREWFRRYGLITVFVPTVIPFLPLPLKVFVVSAAYFHTSLGRFVLVVLAGRLVRYFGEAYLGIRLGAGAEAYLRQHAWTLAAVAAAAVAALFLFIHWKNRHRPA